MISLSSPIMLPAKAKSLFRSLRGYLPMNFITLHYLYYIVMCMVTAIIMWGSSTPAFSVTFTDSLFLCVSAMTQAGLNTVNLSQLNTWQQIILFLLMLLGSSILISCAVVHTRKKAFEKRFAGIIEQERKRRKALKSQISAPFPRTRSRKRGASVDLDHPVVDGVVVRGRTIQPRTNADSEVDEEHRDASSPEQKADGRDAQNLESGVDDNGRERESAEGSGTHSAEIQRAGTGALSSGVRPHIRFIDSNFAGSMSPRRFQDSPAAISRENLHHDMRTPRTPRTPRTLNTEDLRLSSEKRENFQSTSKYFESDGMIGRNSQFHSLSLDERERLGGVEYQALVLLEVIVVAYYVLWQLIGCLGIGAWVAYNESSTTIQNGLNPWWVGAFLSISAFNNNGMSLLDANMVAFQSTDYVLITMGLLILAGNTCYPVFLRLILWSLYKLLPNVPYFEEYKQTLRFLLDHPRRCYTTLFPSKHTWWLVGSLFLLNGIDWIAFEVLNTGNNSIFTTPNAPRALDGLFQALAVRSGGFYVVPIANLSIGLLVLYVLMMYISVYPVSITIRNSNVYEERSLGIFADDPEVEAEKPPSKLPSLLSRFRPTQEGSRGYFIRQQLRGQLAHDLWWLCLAVLFITMIEAQQFGRDPVTFAVFNIVFETVSAYGCVGISTGAPNVNFSFCGEWHVLSKLILCAVMLRGRHRGLPVAIDRAVLLPGEQLGAAEEEDAAVRRKIWLDRKSTRQQRDDHLWLGNGTVTV